MVAVDVDQRRVTPPWLESSRTHHPGIDLNVARPHREALELRQLDLNTPVGVKIAELAGITGNRIDDEQVPMAIINKTLAIGALLEPGDQTRRGRLRLVPLAPMILATHPHHGD
jgi:hypothetical protein